MDFFFTYSQKYRLGYYRISASIRYLIFIFSEFEAIILWMYVKGMNRIRICPSSIIELNVFSFRFSSPSFFIFFTVEWIHMQEKSNFYVPIVFCNTYIYSRFDMLTSYFGNFSKKLYSEWSAKGFVIYV